VPSEKTFTSPNSDLEMKFFGNIKDQKANEIKGIFGARNKVIAYSEFVI